MEVNGLDPMVARAFLQAANVPNGADVSADRKLEMLAHRLKVASGPASDGDDIGILLAAPVRLLIEDMRRLAEPATSGSIGASSFAPGLL